MKNLFYYSHPK